MPENLGFCYAALLKNPQTIDAQLALLPDERRSQIQMLMKELGTLPKADLRQRWEKMRKTEAKAKKSALVERYGSEFRTFSPRLQTWLAQAF
jgi:hypothetical protein